MNNDKLITRESYLHKDNETPNKSRPAPLNRAWPEWLEPCPLSGRELSAAVAEIIG